MRRAPAKSCVCAVCECVALLISLSADLPPSWGCGLAQSRGLPKQQCHGRLAICGQAGRSCVQSFPCQLRMVRKPCRWTNAVRFLQHAKAGVSRNARAVELMVQRDYLSSLMMLCYCVLHVLRHFLQWNCCAEDICSYL